MGNWKIVRGVKTNRVKRGRSRAAAKLAGDVGRRRDLEGKRNGVVRPRAEPQRAKNQTSVDGRDVWTVISVSIRAIDLRAVDDGADRAQLSRSAFLVRSALGKLV